MNGKSKRILLADDDEDDRFIFREAILKVNSEIKIVEAEDGYQLLEILEEEEIVNDIAMIVLDMNMPRMTGVEAFLEAKARINLGKIPVLMLSTSIGTNDVQSYLAIGFTEGIKKPFSPRR